jgi:transcriptional regulator with XRE-family HTH domain
MTTSDLQKSIFSRRLSALMEKTNVSQATLAQAVGVTRQTISLYCLGEAKPDIDKFMKIANFFNISYEFLLGVSDNIESANVSVGDMTGLNDMSIANLKLIKDQDLYIISNELIGSDEFYQIVREAVHFSNEAIKKESDIDIVAASEYRMLKLFEKLLDNYYGRMRAHVEKMQGEQ